MGKSYALITIQRLGAGLWNLIGHTNVEDGDLITGTAATMEEAISIAKRHAAPVLFCRYDDALVKDFFAQAEELQRTKERLSDYSLQLGAERQYANQLKAALDADPIKQAEAAVDALNDQISALRHDNQRLQDALDGELLGEVQQQRQALGMVAEYAEYYHQARLDGQGNPNVPNEDNGDLAMPFEMWLDAKATDPNEYE